MALTAGSRLGPYEIVSPLGAGGMGEVYRARDTRLGRDVAIKVLPAHLADRPDLRERFDREARLVSSLSHPNICTLHDVGHEGGVDFLVLELLEGETLADRLSRGPIPPEEVVRLGIQIASALDRAHRSGVVHRDLKPGNVMLTRAGVKLLDFGLAKMAQPASDPAAGVTAVGSISRSQTPLTQEGTILGTFQYMAPEQLEGGEADARTDLFALGAILYEMVTGRKAFSGKSQASLIASIMGSEPAPLSQVAPMTPPALDRVVRACLAKDPEERIQTAHDVVLQLRWIEEGGSQAGVPKPVVARRRSRERLAWGIAAGAGAIAVALAAFVLTRPAPERFPVRFRIQPPPGLTQVSSPKISPNGRLLAFYGTDSTGTSRLWVRPLDAEDAHPLPGTEGVSRRPFWSPDSRFLAYFASDKLRRVDVAGGPPVTLGDAPRGADGSWGAAGIIVFDGSSGDTIRSIRAAGGEPAPVSNLDRSRGEVYNAWPTFLPDGKHFLFNVYGKRDEPKGIRLGTVGSMESLLLPLKGSRVEYAAPGYLLNVRDHTLMAQPFDAGKRRFTGDPFPVADNVSTYGFSGLADFSVSSTGVLVYRQGAMEGTNRLVWIDRTGRELGTVGDPAGYGNPALSPDGSRVAVEIADARGSGQSIWIIDVSRGVSSRFTFTSGSALAPVWSRDGKTVYFTSDHDGYRTLYAKAADGSGEARAIAPQDTTTVLTDVSPDGAWLLATEQTTTTSWDVVAYSLPDGKKRLPLVQTPAIEAQGRVSPDGKELAYISNESGELQVYVQPFPGPGGKWQVSVDGGRDPRWNGDGRELYYLNQSRLYAVTIDPGPPFRAGAPTRLCDVKLDPNNVAPTRYTASTDGTRFLLNAPPSVADVAPFTVVLDWTAGIPR